MENRDMVSIELSEYERLIEESLKLRTLLNHFKKKATLSFGNKKLDFYNVRLDEILDLLFPFEYYNWIQLKINENTSKEEEK